ncbi:cystathionine beta-lyase [Chelatococcus asaccharovorans]|uniref:Cystathionine beta-lyase n=1 Tax=Chelatococcus asaccharovorans TaxID=28210 RepID=A0A2V3UJS0_9HYPH|nr:cystathionine beta-lyase [Chelatococcus asaccharovorans]MBS7706337.1 cystathionine beta-lyase [Chelatococcus asaccharovorans]PXW65020.1 cystathionine beta-lyase [Chelatococcus asaccharovorans]
MKNDTRIVHAGRHPEDFKGAVNVPVYRTSTVIARNMDEWDRKHREQASTNEPDLFYGRHGTPTSKALQQAMAELEGGFRSFVYPSGVSACVTAIMAFAGQGEHVLAPDSVYGPVRRISGTMFKRFGIETEFYDPRIGEDIEALVRPTTRVIYVEAPGSLTFEMQDIPAIAAVAHRHGAVVVMDNTWATPLLFRAFDHGVDVSVHAATKYVTGHSDTMLGVVTANEACYERLKAATLDLGQTASPDDCYLALRGLRTMGVRLARQGQAATELAAWLASRPEVERVMSPALPDDPGHAIWKRDFLGASGLFAFALKPDLAKFRREFIDALKLFALGGSWGGYESLVMPIDPPRTVTRYAYSNAGIRLHVGLEDPDDLKDDLAQAFGLINTRT